MRRVIYALLVAALLIASIAALVMSSFGAGEPKGADAADRPVLKPTQANIETEKLDNIKFNFTANEANYVLPKILFDDAAEPASVIKPASQGIGRAATLSSYYVEKSYNEASSEESSEAGEASKPVAGEESDEGGDASAEEPDEPKDVKVSVAPSEIARLISERSYSSGGVSIFQAEANDIPTDLTALNAAIKSGNGTCGFIAIRLSDGASVAYNTDKLFDCASSFKSASALYAYKQVAAGNYSLSDKLTYTRSDYYGGSGIIKSSSYGTSYTLKQVIDYSLRYSDNAAYIMLQRYIDDDGIYSMMKDIGCPNAENMLSNWPKVSAVDAALWWSEIYSFYQESSYGKELFKILSEATNASIKKALGNTYTVAHKSGSKNKYFHDCGIVMSDDPYLVVIYTYNPYVGDDNYSYLAPIAREIHKLINA